MKKIFLLLMSLFIASIANAQDANAYDELTAQQVQNLDRAMAMVESAFRKCFTGSDLNYKMGDLYNLETGGSEGTADVWPYTAAIEAVNSILEGIEIIKSQNPTTYSAKRNYFVKMLKQLYNNMDYYKGSYTLVSYAQTKRWTVYGVHRSNSKGTAAVSGIENVYDDQMWIIRELLRAYKLTNDEAYLTEALYLTDYVIDGWDCVVDSSGKEYGGITWGPGYNSKHSCSNGPFISPLVWLAEMYKDANETMTHLYTDTENNRLSETIDKALNYITYAKKTYNFQKSKLYRSDNGLYWDMLGAPGEIQYVTVNRKTYRDHVDTGSPGGNCYTYNTGTMLCGAVDLYRYSGEKVYLNDLTLLAEKAWKGFRKSVRVGNHRIYQFPLDDTALNGFNSWFNNVLMRAYVDAYDYEQTNTKEALDAFQEGLDYAWDNYRDETTNFLPIDWLGGWKTDTKTKGFHQFAFASEYAKLIQFYEKQKIALGMHSVQADNSYPLNIYNINGMAQQLSASNLNRGLYIINGEKVVVK